MNEDDETTTTTTTTTTMKTGFHHYNKVSISISKILFDCNSSSNTSTTTTTTTTSNAAAQQCCCCYYYYAYQEWLKQFWLLSPTLIQRKYPNLLFEFQLLLPMMTNEEEEEGRSSSTSKRNDDVQKEEEEEKQDGDGGGLILCISSTSVDIDINRFEFERSLTNIFKKKKIVVEDLGNLNAIELYNSIPVGKDKDGRGLDDIYEIEKSLNVKLVFGCKSCSSCCCDDNNSNNTCCNNNNNNNNNNHVYLVGPKPKLTKKCLVLRNILSHYYWRLTGIEKKL